VSQEEGEGEKMAGQPVGCPKKKEKEKEKRWPANPSGVPRKRRGKKRGKRGKREEKKGLNGGQGAGP